MALPLNVRVFSETEVPQGSEAWLQMRVGVLTGSRCAPPRRTASGTDA